MEVWMKWEEAQLKLEAGSGSGCRMVTKWVEEWMTRWVLDEARVPGANMPKMVSWFAGVLIC
jgi:hypothetical protein